GLGGGGQNGGLLAPGDRRSTDLDVHRIGWRRPRFGIAHFLRAKIAMTVTTYDTYGRWKGIGGSSRDRRLRPISGGSDHLEVVTSVLAPGTELCADCIAHKTGISAREVPSVIARIAKTAWVETLDARCAGCLVTRAVYRLT